MKFAVSIIHQDLRDLVFKYGMNTTLILCAVAIYSLMGLTNWKNYLAGSLNDSEFKKLMEEK